MTVEAELPDGTVLEFPDGTDEAVIQRVVRQQLGVSDPAETQASDRASRRRALRGFGKVARQIDAGVRGAADILTLGFADELAAGASSLPALWPGGETYGEAFNRNVADERAIDEADRQDVPVSRAVGQVAGFGAGLGVGAIADLARFAPNALRVGGGVAGNVARSAGLGATYGGIAGFGSAEGNFGERVGEAAMGAALGGGVGVLGVPVAAAISRGANALMTRNTPRAALALDRAANALRPRTNVADVAQRRNALRGAGAVPTFASATDEAGRGYIRAAASRMTPARDVVQKRADTAALNLPDRMSRVARRVVSSDRRTPQQVIDDLMEQQSRLARETYAEPYSLTINITPELRSALTGAEGQAAIQRALRGAEARRDTAVIEDLRRLQRVVRQGLTGQEAQTGYNAMRAAAPPPAPISGAALDRIQIAMRERSQRATQANARDVAAGIAGRRAQVNETLDGFEGLREARQAYATSEANINAAEAADNFVRPGAADEFVDIMGAASDRAPARAVAARAIERAAGENISSAPGVARRIAHAPEQQARNRALLGEEGARRLQDAMAAEERTMQDLRFVAPNTGPKTQVAGQDAAATAADVGWAVVSAAHSNPLPLLSRLAMRLRTAGLSDADAAAVAEVSTNPQMLDDLIQRIERIEPGRGRWLREIVNQAGGREAGDMAGRPRAVTVESVGGVPFDEWAANQP